MFCFTQGFHSAGRGKSSISTTAGWCLCLIVLAVVCVSSAATAGDDAPPNIVLIISDDHGWRDYGFMGHEHLHTPRLDRLAAESLVFRRGYTPCSLCCPSLASIITGLSPHQHGITCNDPPRPPGAATAAERAAAFSAGRESMNRLLEQVPTLPALLAKRGYLSLQTGKWWQGDYTRGGFTHGMTRGERHGDAGLEIGRKTMRPIYDFIAEAQQQRRPFFVWYAPMMPHSPHDPPPRLLKKYLDNTDSVHVARYWAMIEWFDETCGALLDHLDQQNLTPNTLVLYVADNGWIQRPDNPQFAPKSKTSPYDPGVHTPIMVRWPGRIARLQSENLASSLDLAPTILAAAGLPPTEQMTGLNLLDEPAVGERKSLVGECYRHTAIDLQSPEKNLLWRWMVEDRWRLIVPRGRDAPPAVGETWEDDHLAPELLQFAASNRVELYDIQADPDETRNLADDHPDLVQSLIDRLNATWRPMRNQAAK